MKLLYLCFLFLPQVTLAKLNQPVSATNQKVLPNKEEKKQIRAGTQQQVYSPEYEKYRAEDKKKRSEKLQTALTKFLELQSVGASAEAKAENLSEIRKLMLDLQHHEYELSNYFNPSEANDQELRDYLLSKVEKPSRIHNAGAVALVVEVLRVCMFVTGLGCVYTGDTSAAADFMDSARASSRRRELQIEIMSPLGLSAK